MICLEDGNWYWCDLTWDDTPGYMEGKSYQYFCVNDTQDVNWSDNSWLDPANFLATHIPGKGYNNQLDYQLELPQRASNPFRSDSVPLIRESFTIGDEVYIRISSRTAQLAKVNHSRDLVIPETVTWKGCTMNVTSIGDIMEGRYLVEGTVVVENRRVHLPKTISQIWDGALSGYYLESITVDADNPYFTVYEGVLYTKSYYTLIQYPTNAPKINRLVLPEATVRIAKGAFSGIRNPFDELVLSKNFEGFGWANWGEGYRDSRPTGMILGNVVAGELGHLVQNCASMNVSLTIRFSQVPDWYYVENNVLYGRGEDGTPTRVIGALSTEISGEIVLPDTILEIEEFAFAGCRNLTSVSIGKNLYLLSHFVFENTQVGQITFRGTMSQWNTVDKRNNWDFCVTFPQGIQVVCTDGVIPANRPAIM